MQYFCNIIMSQIQVLLLLLLLLSTLECLSKRGTITFFLTILQKKCKCTTALLKKQEI